MTETFHFNDIPKDDLIEDGLSETSHDSIFETSFETSPEKFKHIRAKHIATIKSSLSFNKENSPMIFVKSSVFDYSDEFQIFSTKKFSDYYILMEKLGEGGSAVVRKVLNKTNGQICAAKVIRTRDPEYLTSIKNEYQLLIELDHPNIISAYDLIFDEENGFVYIIMEYFEAKTLEDYILEKEKLTEEETIHILKQILLALKYIHENNICHRDITANNILISSKLEAKIIDFNISYKPESKDESRLISSGNDIITLHHKSKQSRRRSHNLMAMLTPKGTIEYQAPEILMGGFFDQSIDMWSVGVLTYFCLMGYRPFYSPIVKKLADDIVNCRYTLDNDRGLSNESIIFIQNCLTKYSLIRMSSKEALLHPWIKGIRIQNHAIKNRLSITGKFQDDEILVKQESPLQQFKKSNSDMMGKLLRNRELDFGY